MSGFTQFAMNKFVDVARAQASGVPANWSVGLHVTKGAHVVSTTWALGDYVTPAASNGRLYKCTTAGAGAGTAPTWPTTAGGTVSDGAAVWTEQTNALIGGTFPAETTYTGYARGTVAASLAGLAGTQGAGTTVASSGSSGQTSNNAAVSFGAPTAGGPVTVGLAVWWDASSAGNGWFWEVLTNPQVISNGASAPSAAAGALTLGFAPTV